MKKTILKVVTIAAFFFLGGCQSHEIATVTNQVVGALPQDIRPTAALVGSAIQQGAARSRKNKQENFKPNAANAQILSSWRRSLSVGDTVLHTQSAPEKRVWKHRKVKQITASSATAKSVIVHFEGTAPWRGYLSETFPPNWSKEQIRSVCFSGSGKTPIDIAPRPYDTEIVIPTRSPSFLHSLLKGTPNPKRGNTFTISVKTGFQIWKVTSISFTDSVGFTTTDNDFKDSGGVIGAQDSGGDGIYTMRATISQFKNSYTTSEIVETKKFTKKFRVNGSGIVRIVIDEIYDSVSIHED